MERIQTLKIEYKQLHQQQSDPKQNFKLFHRQVMMIRGGLRGIHHIVRNLQPYVDEFCYSFNRSNSIVKNFHNTIERMIYNKPVFINQLNLE